MKITARLAVLSTALTLVSGCTGGHLRHKDKTLHEPVQLPSAPTIERSGGCGRGCLAGAVQPVPVGEHAGRIALAAFEHSAEDSLRRCEASEPAVSRPARTSLFQ